MTARTAPAVGNSTDTRTAMNDLLARIAARKETKTTDRPTHRDCGGRIRPAAYGYPATCDACAAEPVPTADIIPPTDTEGAPMTSQPTTAQQVAAALNNWNRQPAEDQDPANWFDIVEDADPINEIDDEFGAHTGDTAVFADGSSVEYTPGSFGGDWTANEAHECDDDFLAIDPSDPNPGSTLQYTREEYEAAGGDYAAMVEEFRTAGAWCCYEVDGVKIAH